MTFLIATQNRKKLTELERILHPLGVEIKTPAQAGINLSDVEETGASFEENARIKAAAALERSGLPSIADDSGLEVSALGGAPGIFSARYAGEGASDSDRIQKLLSALKDVPEGKRQARFVCAICCLFPDGREFAVRETCEGVIAFAPQGEGGFGYDPIFLLDGVSFARMTSEQKDKVSHRGKALRALEKELRKLIPAEMREDQI